MRFLVKCVRAILKHLCFTLSVLEVRPSSSESSMIMTECEAEWSHGAAKPWSDQLQPGSDQLWPGQPSQPQPASDTAQINPTFVLSRQGGTGGHGGTRETRETRKTRETREIE